MSRRIDIELTSRKDDSQWTWRAVGAREPKGVLPAGLLPPSVGVGTVLRAEIDQSIDGIEVLAVAPVESRRDADGRAGRIEILGRPVTDDSLVTTVLAGKGRSAGRGHRKGPRDRDSEGGRDRTKGRERTRDGSGPDGSDGHKRSDRGPTRGSSDRPGRGDERRADRPRRQFTPPPPMPERPKAKRLRPLRTHRSEVVEGLPEEQRPVAEQVLLGGIPAVRRAIEQQNEEARKQGGQAIEAKGVIALAEGLLPRLREAEWRDRADAASKVLDELDLRDLRSVVAAAELGARDDSARSLAEHLREGLERRVAEEHKLWLDEIGQLVEVGRVARALRVAGRPPKAGSPLPDELASKLIAAAGAAMTPETSSDRYATMIDAVATSPVRSRVVPLGVPSEPSDDLVKAVRRFADKAPGIATAFGRSTGARGTPGNQQQARIPAPPTVEAGSVADSSPDLPTPPAVLPLADDVEDLHRSE